MTDPLQRLLSKIQVDTNGCWIYCGACDNAGYGIFWLNGTNTYAHRSSWSLHNKTIPLGLNVLHKCDIKPCINPEHLFVGTHQENTNDMIQKGRRVQLYGKARGNTVITEQTAKAVKIKLIAGESKAVIARDLNISYSVVKNIGYGKAWSWLNV